MPLDFLQPRIDEESASSSTARERLQHAASELWNGLETGFSREVDKALENPGEAGLKFGVSALTGVGLAALQRKAGMGRLFAEAAGFSMTCAFATDIALQGSSTVQSLKSAYAGDRVDLSNVGKFAFDTTLMTSGAMVGAGSFKFLGDRLSFGRSQQMLLSSTIASPEMNAQTQLFHAGKTGVETLNYEFDPIKIKESAGPTQRAIPSIEIQNGKLQKLLKVVDEASPSSVLYDKLQPSILRLEYKDSSRSAVGSAIVLEDGWIATAHHMIRPTPNLDPATFHVEINGQKHPAYPVWKDVSSDIALLRLREPSTVLPPGLKLGWTADLKPNEWVSALGFPAESNKVVLTGGPLLDVYAKIDCPSHDPVAVQVDTPTVRIQSKAATWSGNSGGALVNGNGEVVGIVTSGIPERVESFSTSVEHLRLMLSRARETPFGKGPVNQLHTIGRVVGRPGDTEFSVSVDGLKPDWLQTSLAETVKKPQ